MKLLATCLALVKELRQAYLREAMQGKLVPQDSADEPAEILLEKIKAEKEKLIAEKKIKRDKPLPPINAEEIPFEIPSNWTWCRLGNIANSMSTGPFGTMLHQSDYVKEGIPLVNPMNIVNGRIVPSGKMLVNEETKKRLSSYELQKGDIVVARRGEMGRCAVVTENESGWLCGTGSFFISLSSFINRDFFVKVFSSNYSKLYLSGFSVGSTMDNLNHRILNSYPFPLPPLAEQERIVAKLEKLMKFCDELEANIKQGIANADQLLQVALKEALEPKVSKNIDSDSFEQFCFLASKENWCWNIYCTTCGQMHFRYAFLELSKGKSPKDADWVVTSKTTNYSKILGSIPRTFTTDQKHLLLENFKNADLSIISAQCRFPDWLGYLGLVIHHLFGNFDDDKILSNEWASQLKKLVPVSSGAYQKLDSIVNSENKLLTLNNLEICENDLKFVSLR